MTEADDALKQALGCYFHQDWMEEFESEQAAIAAIIRGTPIDEKILIDSELEELLSSTAAEDVFLDRLRNDYGCYLDPAYRGITIRQWLLDFRAALAPQRK